MLPFPILNQYGNIILKVSLLKTHTCFLGHMFLTTNGDLYAYGDNRNNRFGVVDTNLTILTKVLSGVKNFFSNLGYTIALMNDGTVKGSGRLDLLGIGVQSASFVDCTLHFSSLLSTGIRDIMTPETNGINNAGHIYVLDNNGDVWVRGRNSRGQLGTGNTTNVSSSFVKSISSVKCFCGTVNGNTALLITTDNRLMYTGSAVFSTVDVLSWTVLATDVYQATNIGGGVFYQTGAGYYIRGVQVTVTDAEYFNAVQPSASTAQLCNIPFIASPGNDIIFSDNVKYYGTTGVFLYSYIDKKYYTIGTNGYGRLGSGTDNPVSYYSAVNLPSPDKILNICTGRYFTTIVQKDSTQLIMSGAYNGVSTASGYDGPGLVNYPSTGSYPSSTVFYSSTFQI